jgi:hypothetical protein
MTVSVKKVSVALGNDELQWARRRAEREGTSLSAVLTDATRVARESETRKKKQQAAWSSFTKWATAGKGPPPAAIAAAERELNRR